MRTWRDNPLIYDEKKWQKLQRNRGRPALPLPPVKDTPPARKFRLRLGAALLVPKRQRRVVSHVAYGYSSVPRSKRTLRFLAKALGVLALSAVVAVLVLTYGQPYIETSVLPYLETIRAALWPGSAPSSALL